MGKQNHNQSHNEAASGFPEAASVKLFSNTDPLNIHRVAVSFNKIYFGHGGLGYIGLTFLVALGATDSKVPFCHCPI